MRMAAMDARRARPGMMRIGGVVWLALAALACLSVFVLNGTPLSYFDTGSYVAQGRAALTEIGLWPVAPPGEPGLAGADPSDDGQVDGGRSIFYGLLLALSVLAGSPVLLVALQAATILFALWLPVRVALRESGIAGGQAVALTLPVLAATAGALPFYVAYLMPDIFAPVLLASAASLTAQAHRMRRWEVLASVALLMAAVLAHISHMMILALILPVSAVVAALTARPRWWLGPLAIALAVGAGFAERGAFRSAVETKTGSEVVYRPFITARLIADGPGWRYLEARCPDASIPACALHAALSRSDDPMRLTPSHILFETSAELGSYRLLPPEAQKRVAQSQTGFFFDVLAAQPVSTLLALAANTLRQSVTVSPEMTVPSEAMAERARILAGMPEAFPVGRLTTTEGWLAPVETLHGILYALSLAVLLGLTAHPRALPPGLRVTALMILAGILVNAFVCGAVSQPASRYGARVIWLLPFMAALMALVALRRGQGGAVR